MNFTDKIYDLDEEDIDKLLYGFNLDNLEKDKKKKNNKCISCNSDSLILDSNNGYSVCENCGVINKEFLNDNPEFAKDNSSSSRYGCPINPHFPKSALGTKIKTKYYSRISSLQSQGQMPYKEKSLLEVFKKIQKKCKDSGITQPIIDTAKNLYKKITESKHSKGKRKGKSRIMRCVNRRSMIAACVFYACKLEKVPMSPKEIADIYSLEIKNVNRGCRKFLDFIDLDSIMCKFKSSQSCDFIERFANKLNIDEQYINKAKDISKNIHKLDLASTHEPPSVAAGCLLLVSNMHHLDLSKKSISDVFNISDVTISKTYRRIHPYYKIITNNNITNLVLEKKNKNKKKIPVINNNNLVRKEEENVYLSESEESYSDSDELNKIKNKKESNNNFIEI